MSSWGKIFIDAPFFVLCPFLLVAVLIHTLLGKISERGIKKGKDSLWFTGFRGFSPWPVVSITVDYGEEGHHGNKR